jgi:protein TonB
VDTGNQQWAIPWIASPIAADKNRQGATPKNPLPQSRKDRPRFQTWVLSPPRQAQRTAGSTEPEKPSLPIPIGVSGNSERLAGSSALTEIPVVGPPALSEPKQAASVLREGAVIHRVEPVYPALAQGQRIEGTVKLRATIGPDGSVRSVEVLGGPAPLVLAATQAVRQWRYSPTLLNGTSIGTTKDIDIVFRLRNSN